jgi:hypothetical protein
LAALRGVALLRAAFLAFGLAAFLDLAGDIADPVGHPGRALKSDHP